MRGRKGEGGCVGRVGSGWGGWPLLVAEPNWDEEEEEEEPSKAKEPFLFLNQSPSLSP